jgi:hypothetical protein
MSAAETIRQAEASGIRLEIEGADLILDAILEPSVDIVNAVRQYKVEIIELLATPGDRWTAEDWQLFFDERAGIAEFDGGLPRLEAEARALECCVVEWLNQKPSASDPDRCAWCGQSEEDSSCVIVPFGTESHGHTWLHHHCWQPWSQIRREEAISALVNTGIIFHEETTVYPQTLKKGKGK